MTKYQKNFEYDEILPYDASWTISPVGKAINIINIILTVVCCCKVLHNQTIQVEW